MHIPIFARSVLQCDMFEKMLEQLITNFNLNQTPTGLDVPYSLNRKISTDEIIKCIYILIFLLKDKNSAYELKKIIQQTGSIKITAKHGLPLETTITLNFATGKPMALIDTSQGMKIHDSDYGAVTQMCRIDVFPLELYVVKSTQNLTLTSSYETECKVSDTLGEKSPLAKYSYAKVNKTISLFSIHAICDLNHFLHINVLKIQQKYSIAKQLLLQLQYAHRHGVILQDIKSENILVYPNGCDYTVKIADFGIACLPGDSETATMATLLFESPEISFYYKNKKKLPSHLLGLHDYFHQDKTWKSYANYMLETDANLAIELETMCEQIGKPNKKNDLYALGIVMHHIFFGSIPRQAPLEGKQNLRRFTTMIKSNQLIYGLLYPFRKYRFKAKTALQVLEKMQEKNLVHNKLAIS